MKKDRTKAPLRSPARIALLLAAGLIPLEAEEPASIEGADGWRFLPAEIRFLEKLADGSHRETSESAIEVIADFNRQLRDLDIRLIVVPVPPKVIVHPGKLPAADPLQTPAREALAEIFSGLESTGVHALDLLPAMEAAARARPVFLARDTHWNGEGIGLAAAQMQALFLEAESRWGDRVFESKEVEISIRGDLGGEEESVQLTAVFEQGGVPLSSNKPDRSSPVLLLGDSHLLVFHAGGDMHAAGAGLADQLAAALGGVPDVIGVRGSGATSSRLTLARRARSDLQYLDEKRLLIWCFAAREFTEADRWQVIPVGLSAPDDG